jgi:hypothetical protein
MSQEARTLLFIVPTLFVLLISQWIMPTVFIFTCSYNRPDFIKIQHKTLQHFFEDEYEFIVFNDAPNESMAQKIKAMCDRCGVQCIRISQEIHDRPYLPRWPGENYNYPTIRNVNVVQYSLDTLGFDHDDIVVLLESDVFLVKKFSVREMLNGYDLAGRVLSPNSRTGDGRIKYIWHGLAFLDMRRLPNKHTLNFNCGRVENTPIDGGGHSYYYLKNNPGIKAFYINHNFSRLLPRIKNKDTLGTCLNTVKYQNIK